jgi:hypothetical protein
MNEKWARKILFGICPAVPLEHKNASFWEKNILFVHLCHHIEEIKVVVENGIQLYGKDESRCGE